VLRQSVEPNDLSMRLAEASSTNWASRYVFIPSISTRTKRLPFFR
jgi:hypothetical protein